MLSQKLFPRIPSNSKDLTVNNCEFNREGGGDDTSFHMYMHEDSAESEGTEGFGLYRTGTDTMTVKPYVVSIQLEKGNITMEIDTGASCWMVLQYSTAQKYANIANTLLTNPQCVKILCAFLPTR